MSCKCKPIYAERDTEAQGPHYTKHICHMTGEGLHDKSEIAAELAHRDIEIERLKSGIKEVWKGIDATGRRMCEQGIRERDDGERVFGYAVMLKMILKDQP